MNGNWQTQNTTLRALLCVASRVRVCLPVSGDTYTGPVVSMQANKGFIAHDPGGSDG